MRMLHIYITKLILYFILIFSPKIILSIISIYYAINNWGTECEEPFLPLYIWLFGFGVTEIIFSIFNLILFLVKPKINAFLDNYKDIIVILIIQILSLFVWTIIVAILLFKYERNCYAQNLWNVSLAIFIISCVRICLSCMIYFCPHLYTYIYPVSENSEIGALNP